MPQIIPIKDLKNTAEISEKCHATSEPLFVTKNGYGDMVIMSIENYEKMAYMNDIYRKLEVAELSIGQGKTIFGTDSIRKLREKYEL